MRKLYVILLILCARHSQYLCVHQLHRCMMCVLAHINNGFWMAHKQKIQSRSS
jgi:hypothetical protein